MSTEQSDGASVAQSKFEWIRALAADSRVTNGDKFILTFIALYSLDRDAPTFRVRQSTVAENCATNTRQVGRAIKEATESRYIELVEERKRGRGHHIADRYRLILPVIEDDLSPITTENTGQNRHKYRTKSTEIEDNLSRNYAPDLQERAPKGFTKGIGKGVGGSAAPHPTPQTSKPTPTPANATLGVGPETDGDDGDEIGPEPARLCRRHPDGTDVPCGGCREARVAHEEWDANRREVEAERRAVSACGLCDGEGYRLGPGGERVTVPKRRKGSAPVQTLVSCDHRHHDPDCADCAGTGSRILGIGACRCKPSPKKSGTHTAPTARRFGDLCTVCDDVELWSPPEIERGVCEHCWPTVRNTQPTEKGSNTA